MYFTCCLPTVSSPTWPICSFLMKAISAKIMFLPGWKVVGRGGAEPVWICVVELCAGGLSSSVGWEGCLRGCPESWCHPVWGAPAAGRSEESPPWRGDAGALAGFEAESGWGWDLAMMQVKDRCTGNEWVGWWRGRCRYLVSRWSSGNLCLYQNFEDSQSKMFQSLQVI